MSVSSLSDHNLREIIINGVAGNSGDCLERLGCHLFRLWLLILTWLSALIILLLAKAAFEAWSWRVMTASLASFSSAAASSAYF
jgi:hypothetical protein